MAHTVRIDDDVYRWLRSKAQALGETPNAFLRQMAEREDPGIRARREEEALDYLDTPPARGEQLQGRILNHKWNVNAVQALYHPRGRRFNKLDSFPGALMDMHGYLRFETVEEYYSCPGLQIGKDTWAPHGIASIPRYIRIR